MDAMEEENERKRLAEMREKRAELEAQGPAPDMTKMTVAQLKQMCKERVSIQCYSGCWSGSDYDVNMVGMMYGLTGSEGDGKEGGAEATVVRTIWGATTSSITTSSGPAATAAGGGGGEEKCLLEYD